MTNVFAIALADLCEQQSNDIGAERPRVKDL
jgi:hypothetical protein